eukprot:gnl/MRDRNA2_/MRDRNA2_19692_c0_seq1.p1 gnl/MRDRNA2_/MRDRNA2_19692_c0~~gnl/MRDRNA2_/MRDRNA2_19692_c0_seq1.p1  ORF type:complete len:273 (-),score=54.90 gnl/MRDRNA2_/MRDRNA2_19692_c0_seq1:204-1022(-)
MSCVILIVLTVPAQLSGDEQTGKHAIGSQDHSHNFVSKVAGGDLKDHALREWSAHNVDPDDVGLMKLVKLPVGWKASLAPLMPLPLSPGTWRTFRSSTLLQRKFGASSNVPNPDSRDTGDSEYERKSEAAASVAKSPLQSALEAAREAESTGNTSALYDNPLIAELLQALEGLNPDEASRVLEMAMVSLERRQFEQQMNASNVSRWDIGAMLEQTMEEYKGPFDSGSSELISPNVVSIPFVAIAGVFAGSCVTFMALQFCFAAQDNAEVNVV